MNNIEMARTHAMARTQSVYRDEQFGYRRSGNRAIYRESEQRGFDYILNPNTGELHQINSGGFCGSHNLASANLNEFIGIINIGIIPIHSLPDGAIFPLYEQDTGRLMGHYRLNKCEYCFGKRMNRFV
jgi:hypothetical protein